MQNQWQKQDEEPGPLNYLPIAFSTTPVLCVYYTNRQPVCIERMEQNKKIKAHISPMTSVFFQEEKV